MNSRQANIIAMAKRLNLDVLDVEITGGSHYRMRLQNSLGMRAFFIFAYSTSDKARADKNNTAKLRRFAEGQDPRPQR